MSPFQWTALQIIACFWVIYAGRKVIQFLRLLKETATDGPGEASLFSRHFLLANLFPVGIPRVVCGHNHTYIKKFREFEQLGRDVLCHVSVFPSETIVQVANASTAQEILLARARFPKTMVHYEGLNFFGGNIVAAEGEQWKKYRKIVAPSFSERNTKLVWDEVLTIMSDLFNNMWDNQDTVVIEDCLEELTLPIALFVIGAAGFGRRLPWKDDLVVPAGHSLTFKEALHRVSIGVVPKLIVPSWIDKFSPAMNKINAAFDELDNYMKEMIHARRSGEKKEQRYDLFSSLLDANDSVDGPSTLTEREVLGNIFIFLLAGHETTAHTLCFAFALLAIYQDEQEKLYQEIKSVLDHGKLPKYEEMGLFAQSMAVLNEALRLFPSVTAIVKTSEEDTFITNGAGESVPVRKGSQVEVNIVGLHYNPKYWIDPLEFKPSRFREENWPRDALIPFSYGPRACLGKKFAETEAVAILTMMIWKYKIEVPEEYAGMSLQEKKDKLLKTRLEVTLTPASKVPLVFRRRV